MNKKNFITLGVSILLINILSMTIVGIIMMKIVTPAKGIRPMNGMVPNAETAIKIAEAVWYPVYGNDIYLSQPFTARYSPGEACWVVEGSLRDNLVGGVPIAKIEKTNGNIIYFGCSK